MHLDMDKKTQVKLDSALFDNAILLSALRGFGSHTYQWGSQVVFEGVKTFFCLLF